MGFLIKVTAFLLGGVVCSSAIALEGTTTADISKKIESSSILFQVIQSQIIFDKSTIESATIVPPENSTDTQGYGFTHGYAIDLKLKPDAANEFSQLTGNSIGKHGNIVLNGIVISSPIIQSRLGAQLLITGLTKKQANQFIKGLSTPEKK